MVRKTTVNLEDRYDEIVKRAIDSGFFKDQTSVFNFALELLNRHQNLGVNGDTFAPSDPTIEVKSE